MQRSNLRVPAVWKRCCHRGRRWDLRHRRFQPIVGRRSAGRISRATTDPQKHLTYFFGNSATSGSNYIGYIIAAIILGIIALVLAGLTLPVLMCMPAALIKVSLVGMIILSGAMVVIAFMNGSIFGGIIGAIFFLVFLCYAKAVWSRIPFAAVNLLTACTAIRKNCGAIVIAYFMTALTFAWAVLWTISLMGVWEEVVTKNCVGTQSECLAQTSSVNYGYLFLLFLSLFFTEQVIQNTTHVIVAGTVGGWWFSNEGGCCSAGVMGSTIRALTTSFGSICFGSLLVAILQALKALANSARNNENQIAICIAGEFYVTR